MKLIISLLISTTLVSCSAEQDAKTVFNVWLRTCADDSTSLTVKDGIFMAECKK